MERAKFTNVYEYAKTVVVHEDSWFNFAGYFWMSLTEKQLAKMVQLMVSQGATIYDSTIDGWKHEIRLVNSQLKVKVD